MIPTLKYVAAGGILGGVAAMIGVFLSARKTEKAVEGAVAGTGTPEVKVRLTHYYPFAAVTEAEKKMEGGTKDRKSRPLRTVEDFLSGRSDYVSLAGDHTLWPDGQKLLVPWGDKTLVGRVVDTGGNFYGSKKVIRAQGYEPIDVCVFDRGNKPPKNLVTARVVPGDHFGSKKGPQVPQIARMGLPPSTEVGSGLDLLGAELA